MKIFLDTAEVVEIEKGMQSGLVDGVTTNPSHVKKSGRCFEEVIADICKIVPEHVSAEAVAEGADAMVDEALRIASIAPQVVVKIPMTPAGMEAVAVLEHKKSVRTNVTMVFSAPQALMAMKAGASFVSIVLSRLENVAHESDSLVFDTMAIKENYGFQSEVIAGSVKSPLTILSCLRAGVDIATIPWALFQQLFLHPLTDAGLAQFDKDWAEVPKQAD